MSIDMTSNFFKLITHFRRHDLSEFTSEHERLFADAAATRDHLAVTSHYYSVMSEVIDHYFNGNFHFVPPFEKRQTLEEALKALHRRIAEELGLYEGEKKCVDVGCGIGTVVGEMAAITRADFTGITIAENEAQTANANFERDSIADRCKVLHADAQKMPLEDGSQDAAYAIYALKYFVDLRPVLSEVSRILKPGGRFLIYDLIKTDKFDEKNDEHCRLIHGLEYACGMPALHNRAEMISRAAELGLSLIHSVDLEAENRSPFHYCFSGSPAFMFLAESPLIDLLIRFAQLIRFLPAGFRQFNRTFLSGTVSKIVRAGELGILSGAEMFVFEKK